MQTTMISKISMGCGRVRSRDAVDAAIRAGVTSFDVFPSKIGRVQGQVVHKIGALRPGDVDLVSSHDDVVVDDHSEAFCFEPNFLKKQLDKMRSESFGDSELVLLNEPQCALGRVSDRVQAEEYLSAAMECADGISSGALEGGLLELIPSERCNVLQFPYNLLERSGVPSTDAQLYTNRPLTAITANQPLRLASSKGFPSKYKEKHDALVAAIRANEVGDDAKFLLDLTNDLSKAASEFHSIVAFELDWTARVLPSIGMKLSSVDAKTVEALMDYVVVVQGAVRDAGEYFARRAVNTEKNVLLETTALLFCLKDERFAKTTLGMSSPHHVEWLSAMCGV